MNGTTLDGAWDEISEHAGSLSGPPLRREVLGRFAGLLRSDDIIRFRQEDLSLEGRRR